MVFIRVFGSGGAGGAGGFDGFSGVFSSSAMGFTPSRFRGLCGYLGAFAATELGGSSMTTLEATEAS